MKLKIILLLLMAHSLHVQAQEFTDVKIDEPYRLLLTENRLLMQTIGPKVIVYPDGKRLLISVGSTEANDGSPVMRMAIREICRAKALASFVGETKGIEVHHVNRQQDVTIVTRDSGPTVSSISEYTNLTKAKIRGIARDMPEIGHWYSEDKTLFFVAIGLLLDRNGEPVETK